MFYTIDFETRSRSNLRKEGLIKYSLDPSTEVLCFAFKKNDGPTYIYHFKIKNQKIDEQKFLEFLQHVIEGVEIRAHNAPFEYYIWKNVLRRDPSYPELKLNQIHCSLAKAAMFGLPKGLAQLAMALGTTAQKDLSGSRLMMRMCKPNKKGQWFGGEKEFFDLGEYCKQDVETEYAVELLLIALPAQERKLWELTEKINAKGLRLDLENIEKAINILNENDDILHEKIREATDGRLKTGRQLQKLLKELQNEGLELETLNKVSVRNALKNEGISPTAELLLLIRQEIAMASVRKFVTMRGTACKDERARGLLKYYGASTGRWSSALIQVQNLYRPTIKDTDTILDALSFNDYEFFSSLYDSPAEACASIIRNMIIPQKGYEFFDADYSAIEARLLAWLAGETDTLLNYQRGVDVYKIMASKIYNISVKEINEDQRYMGKKVELGAGYGLGHVKFKNVCYNEDIEISEDFAKTVINIYRQSHPDIVSFWYELEAAAIEAVQRPNSIVTCRKIAFMRKDKLLMMRIPSGRKLYYYKPFLKEKETKVGRKVVLHYLGQKTGKAIIETTYGGKLCENATQAAARDILAEAMVRLENKNYETVLTVHDEILCEVQKNTKDFQEFIDTVQIQPQWALDLPLKVSAWRGDRYHK